MALQPCPSSTIRRCKKNRRKVNREDFQYKGPKPQSKETAIAMIADSVEAASRSLDTYSKDSLSNLIQRIINTKMMENQFDECKLTVGDLNIIKTAFLDVLNSSFHSRPKYPNLQETKMLEKKRNSPALRKARLKKNTQKSTSKRTNRK